MQCSLGCARLHCVSVRGRRCVWCSNARGCVASTACTCWHDRGPICYGLLTLLLYLTHHPAVYVIYSPDQMPFQLYMWVLCRTPHVHVAVAHGPVFVMCGMPKQCAHTATCCAALCHGLLRQRRCFQSAQALDLNATLWLALLWTPYQLCADHYRHSYSSVCSCCALSACAALNNALAGSVLHAAVPLYRRRVALGYSSEQCGGFLSNPPTDGVYASC